MAKIKASKREALGTNKVRKLREAGDIPAVIYGHGEGSESLTINEHDVDLAINHGERVLELEMEGKTVNALIKDVQYDTFGDHILHMDLVRVDLNERTEVTLPVTLIGTPMGAKDGGVLQQLITDIKLDIAVCNIPEEVRVMVSGVKLDEKLSLSDIELPDGAKLLDDPTDVLCTVAELAEAPEPVEGEEMLEPEVIGAKPEEDEEAAE